MDNIDRHTLKALQKDGRKKNYELAKETGLAPSTMLDRVKKLEDKGIIKGYRAVMNPEKLGLKAQGFACISLDRHQVKDIEILENEIKKISNVRACYHITGRFDYLLHVVALELGDLGDLIKEKLATIPGMGKIETFIVYAEVKPDQGWPIDAAQI
ncbi:MAG: Lrp/AsnC family transcriptional regulator [Deltaproteobacteria bacterium]|nr:Lrp/AsnC family transcriptional regulator [Deltaproteobacteria bacterium]